MHQKVLRDVKKDYISSISIVLLIAIGIGAYTAPVAGWISLSENIEQLYERYHFEDVHVPFLRPVSITQLEQVMLSANQSILDQLWMNVRLVIDVSLLLKNNKDEIINKVQLRLIGVNLTERALSLSYPDKYRFLNDIFVFDGNMIDEQDVGTHAIVLDPRLASEYDLAVGQEIHVTISANQSAEVTLLIKGLGSNPEYVVPLSSLNDLPASSKRFGVGFISLKTLQQIVGANDKINDLIISLKESASITRNQVAAYFQDIFEENGLLILPPYTREYQMSNYILWLDLRAINRLGTRYPLYMLFIGSVGTYLVLSRRVKHQKRFIGLALASGYSRRDIFIHYLEYAYFLGFIGTSLGIVGGWALSQVVIRLYTHRLAIPTLTTSFPLELLVVSIPLGIITIAIAAILPAWNATKLTPRECLYDPPQLTVKIARTSVIEKVVSLFFPNMRIGTRMALRNLRRSLGRTMTAILVVALALSLFISSRSFLDSGYHVVELLYGDQGVEWDARIQFHKVVGINDDFMDRLSAIKEITDIELTAEFPTFTTDLTTPKRQTEPFFDIFDLLKLPEPHAEFIHQNEAINRSLEGLYLVVTSHDSSLTAPEVIKGQFIENGLAVTEQFAQNYGLDVGDTISIVLPRIIWGSLFGIPIPVEIIQQNVSLVITGLTRDFNSFIAYLDVNAFQTLTDWRSLPLYNRAYLKITPETNKVELRKTLFQRFPEIRQLEYREELEEGFQDVLNLLNVVVTVLSFFSTLLGVTLVVATMLVSIIERQREIAAMEILGASRRFIMGTLLVEYLINGSIGIIMGGILGYYVGLYFFNLVSTELFQWLFHVSLLTYGLSVISALFMIIVSVVLVMQVMFRQPLATATKTFS